ncbi:MAG: hypothetical protein K1X44_01750 [Alphaproteobacteria bacterium]|nr:hypothetical protein [Alphaproteobacteria bacterium]
MLYRCRYVKQDACFGQGTPILMEDGTYKPIEDIEVGDWVMSFKGLEKLIPTKVLKTFKHEDCFVYDLDGLKVTPSHPFLTPGNRYREIAQFTEKNSLVLADGTFVPVPKMIPVDGFYTTYNFMVKDFHTYVAGNYRVHNKTVKY